jgi:hypothetical protein
MACSAASYPALDSEAVKLSAWSLVDRVNAMAFPEREPTSVQPFDDNMSVSFR